MVELISIRRPYILFLTLLIFIILLSEITGSGSGESSPYQQDTTLFLQGTGDKAHLTTVIPDGGKSGGEEENPPIEFVHPGNGTDGNVTLGTWKSSPVTFATTIRGSVLFDVWAHAEDGSSSLVTFQMQVAVRGSEVMRNITTSNLSLTDEPLNYSGSGFLQGLPYPLEDTQNGTIKDSAPFPEIRLDPGDILEVTLVCRYLGNATAQDNVTFLYGNSSYPTGITLPIEIIRIGFDEDDIIVNGECDETDPGLVVINTTISGLFGSPEIDWIDPQITGHEFRSIHHFIRTVDNGTGVLLATWIWNYSADDIDTGRFSLNLTVIDRSGNRWWRSHDLMFVEQLRPQIDFWIADDEILITPDPLEENETGTISITVHCSGDDGLVDLIPNLRIQILGPDGNTSTTNLPLAIDSNANVTINHSHRFPMPGAYRISIEVNPRDMKNYEESGHCTDGRENNIVSLSIYVEPPPPEDDDKDQIDPIILFGSVISILLVGCGVVLFLRRNN